jgi:hypothetical protein
LIHAVAIAVNAVRDGPEFEAAVMDLVTLRPDRLVHSGVDPE